MIRKSDIILKNEMLKVTEDVPSWIYDYNYSYWAMS